MLPANRRKFVFLIWMGLILFKWQFYPGNFKLVIQERSSPAVETRNDIFLNSIKISGNNERSAYALDENILYRVMERYSQDRLFETDTSFKRILFWNKFKGNKNYGVGHGRYALRKSGCPVWQCETSENRKGAHKYDALIFHLRSWTEEDLPKRRSPQQRYVLWSVESEVWYEYDLNPMANFFNWTMTHRWDSDFVVPYGFIKPTGTVPLHLSEEQLRFYLSRFQVKINYAQGKTKMAAWFVSNCKFVRSSRNEVIKELQKYIDIDIYGTCGNLTCPKKLNEYISSEECRDMVAAKYKFYFALENSLCRYYVTEKFFENMRRPILPVVFGLHEDHEMIAPPHSFINAAKFRNMKELADYMILLDKNDAMYNTYFWWKPHFKVRDNQKDKNLAMCHLCAALHNKSLPRKIYHDMTNWWYEQSSCIFSPRIL